MPNLPETGEAPVTQVATQQGPLKRAAVEAVLNNKPAEAAKANTFLGGEAIKAPAVKTEANVALGPKALAQVTTGNENTAVGNEALTAATEGGQNTAVGAEALISLTEGHGNTAVGDVAMQRLTTGKDNVAIGNGALEFATTAEENVAVGGATALSLTTGTQNVAVGQGALKENKTGLRNVAVGNGAGAAAEGSTNIFIGYLAGLTETGENKLYIANNGTTPIIQGVMSATAASQELGFYGTAPAKKPEVTGATVTVKQLAEALATIGLVKVN